MQTAVTNAENEKNTASTNYQTTIKASTGTTALKTSDMTRKSLFAHRPKRFVMEDRPVLGGRKPRGEVLGLKKKGCGVPAGPSASSSPAS